MAICTAAQAIAEATYWLGYCEKASASYATSDDKAYFASNAGSNNYTYFGNLWGLQGQAWCAMFVTTVIYRACGKDKTSAKAALHGLLPYTACNQLYDISPAAYRGVAKSHGGSWNPKAGDVVIFQQNGVRTHTGLVESVSGSYINTIEGNVGDKVNRKQYNHTTSTYVYEFVRPAYSDATTGGTVSGSEKYGDAVTVELNELSYGCTGPMVKTLQRILYSYYGSSQKVSGTFDATTKANLIKVQRELGVTADGEIGKETWPALLKKLG